MRQPNVLSSLVGFYLHRCVCCSSEHVSMPWNLFKHAHKAGSHFWIWRRLLSRARSLGISTLYTGMWGRQPKSTALYITPRLGVGRFLKVYPQARCNFTNDSAASERREEEVVPVDSIWWSNGMKRSLRKRAFCSDAKHLHHVPLPSSTRGHDVWVFTEDF